MDALIAACDWKDVELRFFVADTEGARTPVFVVMPGGAALAINHHGAEGVDIARAKFIAEACNEKIARMQA